jgi:acyl transferase domain-containing protein
MDADNIQMAGTPAEIAVVGLGGIFPDAPNIEAFWKNIRGGRGRSSFFRSKDAAGNRRGPTSPYFKANTSSSWRSSSSA